MKVLNALWFTLRSIIRRRRVDDDLDEELAFHLERETALYEQRGMSPETARREATRHFGGVQRYREECRDVRRARWLDDFASDSRFALRLARRHPGFAANVILISALGIAACSVTFGLVSGILLAPLPFATPERVAELDLQSPEGRSAALTPAIYRRVAAGSPVIEAIAASAPGGGTADIDGEPENLTGC